MNHKQLTSYLLDVYFDMFEAEYYHTAFLYSTRRKFKQYAMQSGELDKIILGYIERQRELLKYVKNKK